MPAVAADGPPPAVPARPVAGLILAAGRASRFGSPKLLARLEGRPILQHVLDAGRRASLEPIVVVLGEAADAIEAAMDWADERRIRNLDPAAGLASSFRLGIDAVADLAPSVDAVVVLLGDQPRTAPGVIEALVEAAKLKPIPWFVVPAYADGGGSNPILIRRAGFAMAREASGDRGLGPIISAHPELVTRVAAAGTNPDIDTPADLARLRATETRVSADLD